jgi:hypothetical protein
MKFPSLTIVDLVFDIANAQTRFFSRKIAVTSARAALGKNI